MATLTGLEPATSAVTGRRANQLRYRALLVLLDRACPQRGSNPCYRLERAASWTARRWGLVVAGGRENHTWPREAPRTGGRTPRGEPVRAAPRASIGCAHTTSLPGDRVRPPGRGRALHRVRRAD